MMKPLTDVKVIDFTTLLPGPMATLILAEAGAEVVKVERPGTGDGMRGYDPKINGDSLYFGLLNRNKRSVVLDLKDPAARDLLRPLIAEADVLVEQFRPGVMDRLELGFEAVQAINPKIVYCSISGYGQTGPKANKAAHDLNYVAESGLLSLVTGPDGMPMLPPTLVADIGGGAYPAVMNILIGLLGTRKTGQACHLDISMNDFVLPFIYMQVGEGLALERWPEANGLQTTGASPRYNIYRTSDGKFLAAAPLEDQFWTNFCNAIDLDPELREDTKDPGATLAAIREKIAARTAEHWSATFANLDACVSVVLTVEEALADSHFASRGILDHRLAIDGRQVPAAPVPVAEVFRGAPKAAGYPGLGSDTRRLLMRK